MSMVINTNTASLVAQAAQANTSKAMDTAMERLSTGKRINTAADDAAGIAISTRLEANIRGLNMAIKNAADGQSLIDTAEGAMNEQANILQRMRELAVQSSNDTNSATDRLAIQDEMTQLRTELDRIASTTTWAGDKLLDGNFLSKNFQIGAKASENVTVSIGSTSSSSLGVYRLDTTAQTMGVTDETTTKTATDFDVLGKEGAAEAAFTAGSDAKAVAAAVNADSSSTGVTATAVTKARISLAAVPVSAVTMTINGGGTATAISASVVSNNDLTALKDAINAVGGTTQVTATFDGTDKSKLILTEADGDDILLQNFGNGATTNLSVEAGNYDGTSWETAVNVAGHATPLNDAIVNGVVRMESSQSFTVSDQEAGTSDLSAVTGYFGTSGGGTASLSATSSISLGTLAGAQSAISVLDGAIARVNEIRSDLGAISNRLDHTINNLSNVVVNTEASQSRIEDADFAAETSNLTKSQILSQAATAMLAQANASKQSVLSLLQG